MRLRWFGQSAFSLAGDAGTVVVDPFGDVEAIRSRRRWDYPPVTGVDADLLLVTHEHLDHNGVEGVGGEPHLVRSTAGTWETPLGTVVGSPEAGVSSAAFQRTLPYMGGRPPQLTPKRRVNVARAPEGERVSWSTANQFEPPSQTCHRIAPRRTFPVGAVVVAGE